VARSSSAPPGRPTRPTIPAPLSKPSGTSCTGTGLPDLFLPLRTMRAIPKRSVGPPFSGWDSVGIAERFRTEGPPFLPVQNHWRMAHQERFNRHYRSTPPAPHLHFRLHTTDSLPLTEVIADHDPGKPAVRRPAGLCRHPALARVRRSSAAPTVLPGAAHRGP